MIKILKPALASGLAALLLAGAALASAGITVETRSGEVRLSGNVASAADIDRAGKIAGGVAGVKSVKNELKSQ